MADIDAKIQAQGGKIRELKAAKSPKDVIEPEVKVLLGLKAEFKAATGKDWKPGMEVPGAAPAAATGGAGEEINKKIADQGDKIRQLKGAKATKAEIEPEVKVLLDLKAQFKAATGADWKPPAVVKEPKKAASPVKEVKKRIFSSSGRSCS